MAVIFIRLEGRRGADDCSPRPHRSRAASAGRNETIADLPVRGASCYARKHFAEQLTNALGAIRLGGFVQREQLWWMRAQSAGRDLACREHIIGDGDGSHGVAPARIEGEMGENLREFERFMLLSRARLRYCAISAV